MATMAGTVALVTGAASAGPTTIDLDDLQKSRTPYPRLEAAPPTDLVLVLFHAAEDPDSDARRRLWAVSEELPELPRPQGCLTARGSRGPWLPGPGPAPAEWAPVEPPALRG